MHGGLASAFIGFSIVCVQGCTQSVSEKTETQTEKPPNILEELDIHMPSPKFTFTTHQNEFDGRYIYRPPPTFPVNASRSGRCLMEFDVKEDGTTENIRALKCSDPIFIKPSVNSVEQWKIAKQIIGEKPISQRAVTQSIIYRLTDEDGNIIPE